MSHALRAITAAAAVTLIAPAALAQVVKIDGSSTVYPVTEGIAEDFQKAKKNAIKVTVGISGTGGGFKKFCRGETDVQNASRPILAAEMADCKAAGVEYIELPVAFDALTVVMNPRNTFLQAISVDELKKIWEPAAQGKITKWNQVNPAWPDAPIKLFGAGSDSGTFDYFTEAINGKSKSSRGETDVSNASRPITKKEMEDCRAAGISYLEMPVAYDALTVVINPKNSFLESATVAEMKKLWEPAAQGKVSRWNQVNPAWPDAPVKLFGAGADSGTFEYFTEAIVGKSKASRGDYTASEDDNVLVQGVSQDVNAIGYFGYAYYAENQSRLKAVPIVEKAGKPAVSPSEATVLNGSYQPLSRPIFIYVSAKSLAKSEVKEFSEYYMKNAAKIAKEVKYVPLPPQAYTVGLEHIAKMKKGTVMGGKNEVGVRIEDLLAREAKL